MSTRFEKGIVKNNKVFNTKIKILEMATKEFAEKNYATASIRDIADRAKVKHSVITYHFGSKENLFFTVMEALYEEIFLLAASCTIDEKTLEPFDKFRQHLVEVAEFYSAYPEFLMIVYKEKLSESERLKKLQPKLDKLTKITKAKLKVAQQLGLIKEIPIDDLYILFSGAFRSLFLHPQSKFFTGLNSKSKHQRLVIHVNQVLELLKK